MGRERLGIGEHGKVRIYKYPGNRHRARCLVRDATGRVVEVERIGTSKEAVTRAVLAAAKERAGDTNEGVRPGSTVKELVDLWWPTVEARCAGEHITESTRDNYARTVAMITDPNQGIPEMTMQQLTPHRITTFITRRANGYPSVARDIRRQLRFMLGYAVEHGALQSNPASVSLTGERVRKRTKPRAATLDDLKALRKRIQAYESNEQKKLQAKNTGGRPRSVYLADIVDVMLGTGTRIGECLAIRWEDVDLASTPAQVTISGTVKRRPGKKEDGGGLYRQPWPKSQSGWRVVSLPKFATDVLLRLQVEDEGTEYDLVFHTGVGTPRDPHNVRTRLREVRGDDMKWLVPHTFRKTVATLVEREHGLRAASIELGHSSEAITAKAYVDRARVAPDVSSILQELGGESG